MGGGGGLRLNRKTTLIHCKKCPSVFPGSQPGCYYNQNQDLKKILSLNGTKKFPCQYRFFRVPKRFGPKNPGILKKLLQCTAVHTNWESIIRALFREYISAICLPYTSVLIKKLWVIAYKKEPFRHNKNLKHPFATVEDTLKFRFFILSDWMWCTTVC